MTVMTHTDEILFISLVLLASVGSFAFWIWMLVDCVRNGSLSSNERLAWLVVIALTHILGALIYHQLGRRSRRGILPPSNR